MRQYGNGIHWLAFVVDGPKEAAFTMYDALFKGAFGELQELPNGGRGFRSIHLTLLGFKVYVDPARGQKEYFHFEIPGQACELIPWGILQGLEQYLRVEFPGRYHYTRIDLAFDGLPFTPMDIEAAILNDEVRSHAKRKTLKVYHSAFEPKDNGEVGTHTTYFGSRQSERMIRIYDKRGFTRLELEMKQKRADLVAKQLFGTVDTELWATIAMSHLRDFISFEPDWWTDFTEGTGRANAIVSTPKQMSEQMMAAWLNHQIAPSLSVMHDLHPDGFINGMIATGRVRRGRSKKLQSLLTGNGE